MNNYLIDDYSLTGFQFLRSLVVSEYGLRHLEKADRKPKYALGHRIIAVLELTPLIGLIVSIVERIVQLIYQALKPLFVPGSWVFYGSQFRTNGPYDAMKASAFALELNAKASPGIVFDPSKITGSISGGTCTAMSLNFLSKYQGVKKKVRHLSKGHFRHNLLEKLSSKGKHFRETSEAMRAEQAAMNTILVNQGVKSPSLKKIQSLVRFRGFEVAWRSPTYRLRSKEDPADADTVPALEIKKDMARYKRGVYLVRLIKPAVNEKLEEYGHTFIYIKETGLKLLYEPNDGLLFLDDQSAERTVEKHMRYCAEVHSTTDATVYRLKAPTLKAKEA